MPIDPKQFELSRTMVAEIARMQRRTIFVARDSLRVGWVAQFRDKETPFGPSPTFHQRVQLPETL